MSALVFSPSRQSFIDFLNARCRTVDIQPEQIDAVLTLALGKIEERFRHIKNKYYMDEGSPRLRVAHASQTVLLLYELSRSAKLHTEFSEELRGELADKFYFLNVSQSSCDLMHDVVLPEKVFCEHPWGAVIGRAEFSRNASLMFMSQCNIGHNHDIQPRIAGKLLMMPGSAVLGKSELNGRVILSHGSLVVDFSNEEDCVVFGRHPHNIVKPLKDSTWDYCYPFNE